MTEEKGIQQSSIETAHPESKMKLVVVILVVLLVVSSMGVFVWYQYYRHWTVGDLMEAVVGDPGPGAPGFKHSLAGKTVTVEGKITNITTRETTLGTNTMIELDGEGGMPLVAWGEFDRQIGEKLEMEVSFEWSTYNDETHVYSPQVAFPNLMVVLPMQVVMDSVNYAAGAVGLGIALKDVGNLSVSVDWVLDPIPLSIANCSLREGKWSWAADMLDSYGFYGDNNETDYIRNMTLSEGANGIMQFVDSNSDGYLDSGDYFQIDSLTRPTAISGIRTYMFIIQWQKSPQEDWNSEPRALTTFAMRSEGVLRCLYSDTPNARLARSHIENGTRFTVTDLVGNAEWGNVTVQLTSDDYYQNFIQLQPLTSDLTGPGTTTKGYDDVALGNITVRCQLVDKTGNGRLDLGDSIALTSINSTTFETGTHYAVSLINEFNGEMICRGQLQYNVTPQSNITLTRIEDGVSLTFAPPYLGYENTYEYFATPWNEIQLDLYDGIGVMGFVTDWGPPNYESVGTVYTLHFLPATLNNLTVFCNITDLEGNCYINTGDRVVLTSGGAEGFSLYTNYTVTLKFKPTGGEIARISFSG